MFPWLLLPGLPQRRAGVRGAVGSYPLTRSCGQVPRSLASSPEGGVESTFIAGLSSPVVPSSWSRVFANEFITALLESTLWSPVILTDHKNKLCAN